MVTRQLLLLKVARISIINTPTKRTSRIRQNQGDQGKPPCDRNVMKVTQSTPVTHPKFVSSSVRKNYDNIMTHIYYYASQL